MPTPRPIRQKPQERHAQLIPSKAWQRAAIWSTTTREMSMLVMFLYPSSCISSERREFPQPAISTCGCICVCMYVCAGVERVVGCAALGVGARARIGQASASVKSSQVSTFLVALPQVLPQEVLQSRVACVLWGVRVCQS